MYIYTKRKKEEEGRGSRESCLGGRWESKRNPEGWLFVAREILDANFMGVLPYYILVLEIVGIHGWGICS